MSGMDAEFITLTEENIEREHLCCIIRSKVKHPGVEAKRAWLRERLREGHVFRKLNIKGCAFIEYAPLEAAWTPVVGDNFLYIYCLWTQAEAKGQGYGRRLMEDCIADARARGRSGVCMLGARKQKAWLTNQRFAEKFGFQPVDETEDGYTLLALSFDGSAPRFAESARRQRVDWDEITVYYDDQCPYIAQRAERIRAHCLEQAIPARIIKVETLEQAKALPGVFNNWAVFYKGRFVTLNQIDAPAIDKLLSQQK